MPNHSAWNRSHRKGPAVTTNPRNSWGLSVLTLAPVKVLY